MQSRRTRQSEVVVCGPSASDPLGKVRASLMLIYGEFEMFAPISERFALLINGGFLAMKFILWIFCLFGCATEICARESVEV